LGDGGVAPRNFATWHTTRRGYKLEYNF